MVVLLPFWSIEQSGIGECQVRAHVLTADDVPRESGEVGLRRPVNERQPCTHPALGIPYRLPSPGSEVIPGSLRASSSGTRRSSVRQNSSNCAASGVVMRLASDLADLRDLILGSRRTTAGDRGVPVDCAGEVRDDQDGRPK